MQSKLKPGAGCSTNAIFSCGGCSLVLAAFVILLFLPHEVAEVIFTWAPITVIGGGYTSWALYLSIQQRAERKREEAEQKRKAEAEEARALKLNENMPYSYCERPERD